MWGTIIKKFSKFWEALTSIYQDFSFNIFRVIFWLLLVTIVLFLQHPLLSIIFLVWTSFFIILSFYFQKFRIKYIKEASQKESEVFGYYSDVITNNLTVKIFWKESQEVKNSNKILEDWFTLEKKSILVYVFIYTILAFISMIWEIGLIYFVLLFWEQWLLEIWTLLLVFTYQVIIWSQIFIFSLTLWTMSNKIWSSLEMLDIINNSTNLDKTDNNENLNLTEGKIEFKNIEFSYSWKESIFKNFNLILKPNEKVALIWKSWSWKSTLTKLLFRFNSLKNWQILIDWQDINNLNPSNLRKSNWIYSSRTFIIS